MPPHTHRIIDPTSHIHAGSSGDMTRAVYDPDLDGKIAEAQTELNYPTHNNSLDHAQSHTLTSHSTRAHSELTDVGATDHHSNTNDPTADQKAALAGTSGTPSVTNKYVTDADSRNSDARTPTSHSHTEYILHSLATAVSDFLVASGAGAFVKKTLADVKAILGLGTAAYTASTDYAPALGTDDNYVTDAEKVIIGNTSGTNTGDSSGHSGLQATLVSGTNIKTINSQSVLGSGDLVVSGQTNIKQTEIDFGTTPVSEASFLITDADVLVGSQLIGSVAYEAPTGKELDELEMDGLDLKFAPGVGQFTLYAGGLDGYIADKFKVNYLIG